MTRLDEIFSNLTPSEKNLLYFALTDFSHTVSTDDRYSLEECKEVFGMRRAVADPTPAPQDKVLFQE